MNRRGFFVSTAGGLAGAAASVIAKDENQLPPVLATGVAGPDKVYLAAIHIKDGKQRKVLVEAVDAADIF